MNKVGRLTMVKTALIYLMIAMDLPKLVIRTIDKRWKVFYGLHRRRQMVAIVFLLGTSESATPKIGVLDSWYS